MKYRAEIDGLRAVAVVPVILFHAGFEKFSGGFVGVDVFFVISGYLITSIIYHEVQSGTFSIITFYERRFRRIFPALFVVCVACIPPAWLWMMPDEFASFSESLLSVAIFASNIHFLNQTGYFSPSTELMPLLHTWSLAVEEQFYAVFPLFLLLFRRLRESHLVVLLVAVAVVSLAGAEWGWREFPKANFYLFPTRAWELMVGALLAIGVSRWTRPQAGWLAEAGSVVGMALVAYATFAYDRSVPFPSVWGIVPVLGTALIIAFATPRTVVGRLLSLGPVVGIGLISYSAYLWHQPLFAFARIRLVDGVTPATYFGLSVLAVFLAYLSWRFVEGPFRNKKTVNRRQLFTATALASAGMIAFGLVGHFEEGFPGRVPEGAVEMASLAEDTNPRIDECHSEEENFIKPEDACVYGDVSFADVGLLGDSHATAVAFQLGRVFGENGHGLREFSYSACPPVVGIYRTDVADDCPKYNEAVRDYVLSHAEPDVLVLVSRWSLFIDGHFFDNKEGGIESESVMYALPLGKGLEFIDDPNRVSEIGRLYRASIQRFLDGGKPVVLVYPIPEVGWNVPLRLSREMAVGIRRDEPLSTSFDVFKERSANARAQLDMLPDNPNLIRIRPEEIFCDTFVAGRCIAELDGKPLYSDDDHLNSIGATMLSEKIVAAAKGEGWLEKED